jgi:predicted KAP-like P-loop ATPase
MVVVNGSFDSDKEQSVKNHAETPNSSSFLPDQPIEGADQDRLDRNKFAVGLAKSLLAYEDSSSLVVALNGPWGSGKSSLLNLTANALADLGASRKPKEPVIVRFNPWNYSSVEQLIESFFSVLSVRLGKALDSKLGKALEGLGVILSAGTVSPFGAEAFQQASKAAHGLGKHLRHRRQAPTSPDEIKERLDEYLAKTGRRIIVIIDDLDRLERDCIINMLRLIRLSAAFKNTTYLTAFDKAALENTLDRGGDTPGRTYLEKIIQVAFDVPPVDELRLQQILLQEIDKVIAPIPDDHWQKDRWENLYRGGMRRLFRTPRDVVRYVNGLRLNFPSLIGEVNPVDFIGLEAIRLFAPPVYEFFREGKDVVLGAPYGNHLDESREVLRPLLDGVFGKAGAASSQSVKEIALVLFPSLHRVYSNVTYGPDWQESWRKARQIASHEFYARYFYLGIPGGEVSETELAAIVALAANPDADSQQLNAFIKDGRIDRALDRLEDYADKFPAETIQTFLTGLLNATGGMPRNRSHLFGFDPPTRIARIGYRLLLAVPDKTKRGEVLRELAQSHPDLPSLVRLWAVLEDTPEAPGSAQPELLFSEQDNKAISASLVLRIRKGAADGSIRKDVRLGEVLFRWRDWAGIEEPKAYAVELLKDDEGLLDFLVGLSTVVVSGGVGSYSVRQYKHISRKAMSEFITPDSIVERVQQIKDHRWQSLAKEQQEAIEAFLNPKDSWMDA